MAFLVLLLSERVGPPAVYFVKIMTDELFSPRPRPPSAGTAGTAGTAGAAGAAGPGAGAVLCCCW